MWYKLAQTQDEIKRGVSEIPEPADDQIFDDGTLIEQEFQEICKQKLSKTEKGSLKLVVAPEPIAEEPQEVQKSEPKEIGKIKVNDITISIVVSGGDKL